MLRKSSTRRRIKREAEVTILERKRYNGVPLAFFCLPRLRHSTQFENNAEMIAQLAMMSSGSGGGGSSNGGSGGGSRVIRGGLTLHRSNSSLELPHSPERSGRAVDAQPLRREYGSHGSIDVVAGQCSPAAGGTTTTNDNIFAMLQDFRSGRASADRLHHHPHHGDSSTSGLNAGLSTDEVCGPTSASSPKLRLKLNRLWGGKENNCIPSGSTPGTVISSDLEERNRRRAFLHYDTQSLTANLGYAAKLRGILLARRRNTATGASAASAIRSPTPDNDTADITGSGIGDMKDDLGDGKDNDLLESCPFFRNEIGGEGEREVALARSPGITAGAHRPSLAYGVSVLEPAIGETLWKHTCPMRKRLLPIESVDEGARYYRKYFFGKEHQNWFGMDEQLGPVAISIRRDNSHYRIIVRTSELLTLRGSVPEEALGLRTHPNNRLPTRELMELVAPEVQISCLRLGTPAAEETLARLDEQGLSNRYKVGVLYMRAGQRTEEEMYNNQHAGPAFLEFLDTIGQRVRLRGFEGYKAGLDTRTDSTGTHSVAATHRSVQVTLHVVTMLPFTPNNRQQLLRKRHIGNDIVTIVFQEPGALPFSPRRIRSQFQHVFIIVRAINPCTDNTQYSVAVSRSKEVPIFGPPVPSGAIFNKGKSFTDFILAKVINAENAAHRSEKFSTMATRTRQEYLKDLATNYSTTSIIDTGQKFSMLSFSSKKKAPVRPRLACDASQRGAICWQVILEESNQNTDCYLGISIETIVLIEEHSRQIVFVSPCVNILGWHAQTNSLRLYYHQGECISIRVRSDYSERDEIMEIVARLRAVTQGSPASELSLRRNSLGQLGFHVQPDGVVTQVESMGQSWQAGLRQGSRLVEICKVAVSTLSHDQMVDLLKTSVQVTVTVIPPTSDGQARRGCSLSSCQYLAGNYESDYENVSNNSENVASQQMAQQSNKNYERSMSPPRSSNSSGYGTGSSSRSFNDPRFQQDVNPGLNTNINHGPVSDDRWYDTFESSEHDSNRRIDATPPPPLPARQKGELLSYTNDNSVPKHYHHDYYSKESNYVSPRIIHEGSYQRLDDNNRNNNLDDPSSLNYAKIQKDNHGNWYGSNQNHQKLSLNQTSTYSVPKSINGNSIRYNEQYDLVNGSSGDQQNVAYDADTNRICQRKPKSDYDECSVVTHDQYETSNKLRDKRISTYEFIQDGYDKKNSESTNYEFNIQQNDDNVGVGGNITGASTANDSTRDPTFHEFIIGEKVTCIKNNLPDRVLTRKLTHNDYTRGKEFVTSSLPPEVKIFDGNNAINDAPTAVPSEDELSNNCENISPALRRAVKHRSCTNSGGNVSSASNASSRNQSPRPKSVVRNSHRNSANLTSSTLQEDLMKLINPDFIADDNHLLIDNKNDGSLNKENCNNNNNNNNNNNSEINMINIVEKMNECSNKAANNSNNNSTNNSTKLEIQNRCRSRENLCGTSTTTLSVLSSNTRQDNNSTNSTGGSEVILTMARPATVISNASTNSSPAPSENKMSKEERLSPRVTKTPLVPLKSANNLIAINRDAKIDSENESECWNNSNHRDTINPRIGKKQQDWSDDRIYEASNSITELQSHLSNLELRVARETRRRLSLEDEVRRLRDENRRLQDENHAAAQQLRRFTEWYFQTIDHQ